MKVSIPLNIPDVEVIKVDTVDGDLVITVESTLHGTVCKRCGRPISQFAGYNDPIQVRHLPCFGQTVWITYRPKHYECPYCDGQPKTTQTVVWHAPRSPYTQAYEDHILKALINSTLEDISQKEAIGYGGVRGIVRRRLAVAVDWSRYHCLRVIGIDEIALKKGYRDFVVIVSAHLDDGDGWREAHCNSCEGMGAALRTYLRVFRGVHKYYLAEYVEYVATFETLFNAKAISPAIIQAMCFGTRLHADDA